MHRLVSIVAALSSLLLLSGQIDTPDTLLFGDRPSWQSDESCRYDASPDRRAFTIACGDLQASVDDGQPAQGFFAKLKRAAGPAAPVVPRTFTMVIPISGGGPVRTSIYVNGYAATFAGGYGQIFTSVNGQSSTANFGRNTDRSFIQTLRYSSGSANELRLTIMLIASRDTTVPGSAAYLNAATIDTDLNLARKRVARAPGS